MSEYRKSVLKVMDTLPASVTAALDKMRGSLVQIQADVKGSHGFDPTRLSDAEQADLAVELARLGLFVPVRTDDGEGLKRPWPSAGELEKMITTDAAITAQISRLRA